MIILINCKNFKLLYENIFRKDSQIINTILNVINSTSKFDSESKLTIIFNCLFHDVEYKNAIISNCGDQLYIINHEKFSKLSTICLTKSHDIVYTKLLTYIMKLEFSWEDIFKNNELNEEEKIISNFINNKRKECDNSINYKDCILIRKIKIL